MRLPFENGKIIIYSKYIWNNFSGVGKEKKGYLNDYNFVLISKSVEKTYNEK
jgi:hypothetical protein